MSDALQALRGAGVPVWLDDLSIPTNPSIFAKAISSGGGDYTAELVVLVAPGVVNTMPEATLRAVADHGPVPIEAVGGHYAEAPEVLDRLAALGVDHDDVVSTLEDDGVATFDAAWDVLADQLTGTLRADAPGPRGAPDRGRGPERAEDRP